MEVGGGAMNEPPIGARVYVSSVVKYGVLLGAEPQNGRLFVVLCDPFVTGFSQQLEGGWFSPHDVSPVDL